MPLRILSDGNPDGALIGSNATDKIGFYGQVPTPQRSNPMQSMIQGFNLGQIITFTSNVCPLANTAVSTCAEQANLVCERILATDYLIGVNKLAQQANVGVAGARISAANTIALNFSNPSTANANITANEISWTAVALRGMNVITQSLAPANVIANGTSEQIFTVGGSNAAATATINAAGQVVDIRMVTGGNGYVVAPSVVITPVANATYGGVQANQAPILTGTMQPLPVPTGGQGATAVAVCANGGIASVIITDPGSGYTVAPTVSFVQSSYIAPGMFLSVTKPTSQAGLGIGNVRIPAKNQIAIQFFNNTAANILPTANENYTMIALNELPAISPFFTFQCNYTGFAATGVNAAGNLTALAVPGVLASDIQLGCGPVTVNVAANSAAMVNGNCTANVINAAFYGGVATFSPAAGVYNFHILRQQPAAPIQIFTQLITPAAVPALSGAEQIFTLTANNVLSTTTNLNAILCNKPSHTPYISICGCRANGSTTVGINFQNCNTTTAITPPAEVYTFAYFPTPAATISANMLHACTIQSCGITFNQLIDLANELQQASQLLGTIKGS